MSVRRRQWTKGADKRVVREHWLIDFTYITAEGMRTRMRELSPVNTRVGAERRERELREALADGTYRRGDEPQLVPTVAEFATRFEEWAVVHNKPSTIAEKRMIMRVHLVPALGSTRLDRLTISQIESYKAAKLKEGLRRKSLKNHLAVLSKLLNLAIELGVVSAVPKVRGVKAEEPEFEFLDFEEADRLVAAADPTWRPLIETDLRTGLRVGELLALRWEDVDLKAARITVRRTLWGGLEGSPKGGKSRHIPLGDDVLAALTAHRHLRGPYVFCSEGGGRLTHSMVKNVVPTACRRAGLAKRLTMHDLRHTFASHLVMRGVTLVAVKELLGHAHISTTMRYAHLAPSATRDAVRLLDSGARMAPARPQAAHSPQSEAK